MIKVIIVLILLSISSCANEDKFYTYNNPTDPAGSIASLPGDDGSDSDDTGTDDSGGTTDEDGDPIVPTPPGQPLPYCKAKGNSCKKPKKHCICPVL